MKCESCANFLAGVERCKFCHWELDPGYNSWNADDWDILKLDFDGEILKEIQYRLKSKGIDCILADIYYNMNVAFLIGCYADDIDIAQALGVNESVVYGHNEQGLVVINLFEEKYLRGELDD